MCWRTALRGRVLDSVQEGTRTRKANRELRWQEALWALLLPEVVCVKPVLIGEVFDRVQFLQGQTDPDQVLDRAWVAESDLRLSSADSGLRLSNGARGRLAEPAVLVAFASQ